VDANADVGSYSYGARPHAVTSAGGVTYSYDANGSQESGDGRTIGYGVFNKPVSITRGSRSVQIHYGPNRERYRRIDDLGQSSETLWCAHKLCHPGSQRADAAIVVTDESNIDVLKAVGN
jgi:hypothetical protein